MKSNLLIIEPDVFERDILSKVFSASYEIKYASDVKCAINTIDDFRPDAVVYDVVLPDIGSLKNIIESKDRHHDSVPLILLVSENSLEFERVAREIGVFYYMIKPFDFKELSEAIHAAVSFTEKQRLSK